MNQALVIQPGLLSTIQDQGRMGCRHWGIPQSGAMDQHSALVANRLLGNNESDAILEISLMGPKLQFEAKTQIAVAGAVFEMELNGAPIPMQQAITVEAGDVFHLKRLVYGCRAYLAVQGGWQTEQVLDSRSWYPGLTTHHRLRKGQSLAYPEFKEKVPDPSQNSVVQSPNWSESRLAVFAGSEFDQLSLAKQKRLFGLPLHLSPLMNRMAMQLEETLENRLPGLMTGPVVPGTVQLTPSGTLIVLMRDAQVTGGYPRVLQLTAQAIDLMAQKKQGDPVQFVRHQRFDEGIPRSL
ncbi:5-oxoprolinase subunit C family protein [Croceiramulus getboli]|nr:biotin-dependent carboxyltransferase family protein [Flavobacteriaceae bacterium YJPT1-3]